MDFMMIAPAGWVDLDYNWICSNTSLSDALINNYIMTHNYGEFETVFREHNLFPEGKNTLKDIKFIDNQYLWATFE